MLIIGAQLESYRSLKDKTLKLSFETQSPTPDNLANIALSSQQFGYLAFKLDDFKNEETELLESLKSDFDDGRKTPSKRLRSVLYLNWKAHAEGYDDFSNYYAFKMEKLISHFKEKLD